MKLDKKDNIRLMKECCIVREIECIQRRNESTAWSFRELKRMIKNSDNLDFENLHIHFDDNTAIKHFLRDMEKNSKFKINLKYYRKAIKSAQKHVSQNELGELTSKLKKQFFQEHHIQNLNVRHHRKLLQYVGTPIATLLATGTFYFSHPSDQNLTTERPQQTETTVPIPESEIPSPELKQQPITEFDNLNIHDTNFSTSMKNDFKSLYLEEYNALYPEQTLSSDEFIIDFNNAQDWIYQVKVGNENRYVSHGDYPTMIQKYFENNQIQPEVISDCRAVSIFLVDADGNIQKDYDEFGNFTPIKLDSAIDGQALYDGNNPKGLLDSQSNSQSLLAKMQDILTCFTYSTDTENDRKIVKSKYINAVKNYQASKESIKDDEENIR